MDKQDTSASLGVSMEQLTKEYQENKLSVIDMLVRNCMAVDISIPRVVKGHFD
jgi:hypothetical protein